MASAASWSDDISTNPKPLLRPVSRSVMIFADCTFPAREKVSCRDSSVALNGRLPTYNFLPMYLLGDAEDMSTMLEDTAATRNPHTYIPKLISRFLPYTICFCRIAGRYGSK